MNTYPPVVQPTPVASTSEARQRRLRQYLDTHFKSKGAAVLSIKIQNRYEVIITYTFYTGAVLDQTDILRRKVSL